MTSEKGEIEKFIYKIKDSQSRMHLQKLFGMHIDEWSYFNISQLIEETPDGRETFLAFGWTKDIGNNYVANNDSFEGNPFVMKKVYMAADGWLNSELRYPYLIAIGNEKPMYRANSFMLMNSP